MAKSMYDYVLEEPDVLSSILRNRRDITKGFVKLLREKEIDRIIISASGSSYNAALGAKSFIERMLRIGTVVEYPSSFNDYASIFTEKTLVIGISQSGRSTSTVDSMKKARELGLLNASLTAHLDSPINDFVKEMVEIACGEETMDYKTKGYSATLITLWLMALEGSLARGRVDLELYQGYIDDLQKICHSLRDNIQRIDKWYNLNNKGLLEANRMMVVGYGPNLATALEGSLKIMETSRIMSAGYEAEEFMHGPNLAVDSGCHVIFIKPRGAGSQRVMELYKYINTLTHYCYLIGYDDEGDQDGKDLMLEDVCHDYFSPIIYGMPFQILAHRLSHDKGIDLHIKRFADFNKHIKTKV